MTSVCFQQRERWLEELGEYVRRDSRIICEAGYMSIPAIAREILEAALDPSPHDGQQKNEWKSRARDLNDALMWVGPGLHSIVSAAATDLHVCIATELLTGKSGKAAFDDTKRPLVAQKAALVETLLDHDSAIGAAWRDLIAACKNIDHLVFPVERVKYLRDNVFALSVRRRQDPGAFGSINTAYGVLLGSESAVRHAQLMLDGEYGRSNCEAQPGSPPSVDELESLSERSIVLPAPVGKFVVWFRLAPGFVKGKECVSHGEVTFYRARSLAAALMEPAAARERYHVVPEELLVGHVREAQLADGRPNEFFGFERDPLLVYVRVVVTGVELHLAEPRARMLLDAVLKVNGKPDSMWNVLQGSLIFGEGISNNYHSVAWGPKADRPSDVLHYENDFLTTKLQLLTERGPLITADAAEALMPVLRLRDELRETRDSDPEAVVRAAVRAIEHCNTWTERGQLKWYEFIDKYLLDSYTVDTFSFRTVESVFKSAVIYVPDSSLGAPAVPELRSIAEDIQDGQWDGPIINARTVPHISKLREIYKGHWLSRSLAELDETLTSDALSRAFGVEKERVNACTDRLRRTRNAAIHGGPISEAACESIAVFARRIAEIALDNVVEAVIGGVTVEIHTLGQRARYKERVKNLILIGDLENLFA